MLKWSYNKKPHWYINGPPGSPDSISGCQGLESPIISFNISNSIYRSAREPLDRS